MRPKVERPQSANRSNRSLRQMTPVGKSFIPEDDPHARPLGQLRKIQTKMKTNSRLPHWRGTYSIGCDRIFQYITFYTPQVIDLEFKLHPFVPDYIPAVGDIDGFIKVARPDGVNDQLGITVLDEPCTAQSEPAVIALASPSCH
ncbi:hypothetical protein GE061_005513 [Apolygus lucorum]|uniref:Intraflagellar transport protein 46 homolog n=1 Tax=Apolygus lucorum TaxID=248454 RepID=A0A8S9WZ49_APOLU|nr:hypothetical protein GE061_005513 [Apolygus lucorum]